MRDQHRLRSITQLVRDIWTYFPEWRYFQLIVNIEKYMGMSGRSDIGQATRFNVEDDITEEALGNLLRLIEDGSGKWPG